MGAGISIAGFYLGEGRGAPASWPLNNSKTTTLADFALPEAELVGRLKEFNPIDNLSGLAANKVPMFSVHGDSDVVVLVEQAQQTISGIEPQTLRDSNRLRQMVARDFEQIQASVGDLLVDRPRRNILRRGQTGAGV